MTETPYQKFNLVDADGNLIDLGGGSGGDASAANQELEIATLGNPNDNPAHFGDEANIIQLLKAISAVLGDIFPNQDSLGTIQSYISSLNSNITTLNDYSIGNNYNPAATTDTGDATLNSLLKRLLSIKLPSTIGQKTLNDSLSVGIASNQIVPVSVTDGLFINSSRSGAGIIFAQDCTGYQSASIQITAIGSATITYEWSNDDITYYPLLAVDPGAMTAPTSTSTTIGVKTFHLPGKFFRARISAFTSGTVTVLAYFRTFPLPANLSVYQGTSGNLKAQIEGIAGIPNPVFVGFEARTSQVSSATNGSVGAPITDKIRRQVVKVGQVRELQDNNYLVLSNTTETTLIPAVASIFNDITDLNVTNASASSIRVDLRDATAGSVRFSLAVPPGDTKTFSFATPLKQSSVNNNWTVQLSNSVTDVRISVCSERTA